MCRYWQLFVPWTHFQMASITKRSLLRGIRGRRVAGGTYITIPAFSGGQVWYYITSNINVIKQLYQMLTEWTANVIFLSSSKISCQSLKSHFRLEHQYVRETTPNCPKCNIYNREAFTRCSLKLEIKSSGNEVLHWFHGKVKTSKIKRYRIRDLSVAEKPVYTVIHETKLNSRLCQICQI